MKRLLLALTLSTFVVFGLVALTLGADPSPEWSMNATVIEACSCPMFCQCYFNTEPAVHVAEMHKEHADGKHFCKFNLAYKVNKGHHGDVKLDGTKFWLAGDLGEDFATGEMDWVVLTFDKAMTPEQREGLQTIVGNLFPVKWDSFTTSEGTISWTAEKESAHATLDGGKTAEVILKSAAGANTAGEPIVIENLKYWGATENDGFIMMPNEVQAYRVGEKAFEYKGTNGFMITIDIDSKSVESASAESSY